MYLEGRSPQIVRRTRILLRAHVPVVQLIFEEEALHDAVHRTPMTISGEDIESLKMTIVEPLIPRKAIVSFYVPLNQN